MTLPGHSLAGHHWLSANGRYSFVAAESAAGPGSLVVLDNDTGDVVADHPYPAGARPHGVFYTPVQR